MISIRALSTVSLLGLLLAVAGCSGEAGTTAGSSTTAQDSVAVTQAKNDHGPMRGDRGGHRGGPESMLVAALHAPINLTAEQTATIKSALEAGKPAAPPAFDKTRASALAASIRAGKVDASSFAGPSQSDIAARDAAHQANAAKELATLHATLTPEQRRGLVDAIAKREADHAAKHASKDGEGATRGKMARFGGPQGDKMGKMGPMGGMLKDLDLTQAQKNAIHAQLEANRPAPPTDAQIAAHKASREAFRADRQAKLRSFVNDSFGASAFVARPVDATKGHGDHADRFAKTMQIVTSVLEASQREKLASRIEAGPPARPVRDAKSPQ